MLGDRIRQARLSRRLSLNDVASRAKISVATLSRIERDKQGVDMAMSLTLSRILKTSAHELIGADDAGDGAAPLATRIARLPTHERAQLWRDLAASSRRNTTASRKQVRQMAQEVEELLAQLDFLRGEIENMQKRLRRG